MKLSRQAVYYHFTRATIFFALGRFCNYCRSKKELEFDIIIPQGDPGGHHCKMSSTSRTAFYKREFYRGNLQILCSKCNSGKNDDVYLPGLFIPKSPQIVDCPF